MLVPKVSILFLRYDKGWLFSQPPCSLPAVHVAGAMISNDSGELGIIPLDPTFVRNLDHRSIHIVYSTNSTVQFTNTISTPTYETQQLNTQRQNMPLFNQIFARAVTASLRMAITTRTFVEGLLWSIRHIQEDPYSVILSLGQVSALRSCKTHCLLIQSSTRSVYAGATQESMQIVWSFQVH